MDIYGTYIFVEGDDGAFLHGIEVLKVQQVVRESLKPSFFLFCGILSFRLLQS
jgi:hypothetical protein